MSRPKLSLRGLRISYIESEPETAVVTPTRLKSSHTSRPLVTQLGLEQGMSQNRLQEARAGDRVAEEMMHDTRQYTDVPVGRQHQCGRRGRRT